MNESQIPSEAAGEAPGPSPVARAGLGAAAAAFLAALGPVGAALVSGSARAQGVTITDVDILNFALNLEYLEGEYYNRGIGQDLQPTDITGVGTLGPVTGGTLVPWHTPLFFEYAAKIAVDEQAHIRFLRGQLGSNAIARPAIDLQNAFTAAAQAAGAVPPGTPFNPFADEVSFFLGAFSLTEVGITAYNGASTLISDPNILSAAGRILATEAYHAGCIRTVLTQAAASGANPLVPYQSQAIADLQSRASGAVTAIGVVFPQNGFADIAAADANGLAFRRTPGQVINVVTLGNGQTGKGGFFPQGLNGTINTSTVTG